MVDATTTAAAAAATTGGSALGKARLAENFDTFLTLLTTQLRNQDPLSPMDSNQFTQQMVQMTGVEQQLMTNDLLKQLVGNTASGISASVALIGKDVSAISSDAALNGGQAKWTYKLDDPADRVRLQVLDSTGKVVHTVNATDNKAGEHDFSWNGKDLNGQQLKDGGTYTLKVSAVNAAGESMSSTTYVRGVVTGVEQQDGATYITINGGRVTWDKVAKINQLETPAATTTTDPTTTDSTASGAS